MTRTTVNFSVRVNEKLYNRGEYLKSKHPRTVSHSRIYAAGLKSIIADAESRGEYVPEDPYADLISFEEEVRADLDKEIAELKARQIKHKTQTARTLAGQSVPKSEDVKKSYVFDTIPEINCWVSDTLIDSDPDRFKPPTEPAPA